MATSTNFPGPWMGMVSIEDGYDLFQRTNHDQVIEELTASIAAGQDRIAAWSRVLASASGDYGLSMIEKVSADIDAERAKVAAAQARLADLTRG